MKIAIVVLAIFGLAAAQKRNTDGDIVVVKSEGEPVGEDGNYKFYFENSDGAFRQEEGRQIPGGDEPKLAVNGESKYVDPDGNIVKLTYSADAENGFQVQGDHLPRDEPPSPAIAKSIALNAERANDGDDGFWRPNKKA